MHNAVFGGAEEIGGASKTVQHSGTHDTGAVGMSVDVDFNWGVHADNSQSPNNLRRVGDLLGSEEELVVILFPAIVETFEAIW